MSRYANFTLNNGEYIPQYAGSALDVINDTNTELQNRHYKNIADMSNLQLLRQQYESQALPGAKEYINTQFKDIDEALQTMTKDGAENSTAKVAALKNRFLGDQGVLNSLRVAKDYGEFKKSRDEITRLGGNPLWNKDEEKRYLEGRVTDETGKLTDIYTNPFNLVAQKQLDYMTKQDEIVKPLRADSWQNDLKVAKSVAGLAGMTDNEFLQTDTWKQLTRKKVDNYLFGKQPNGEVALGWKNYLSSPEYHQQSKILGMKDEDIKNELRSRGYAMLYSEHGKDFIRNPQEEITDKTTDKNTDKNTDPAITVPTPAVLRNIDTLNKVRKEYWGNADDITAKGIKKDFIDISLDFLSNELEDILVTVKKGITGKEDKGKATRIEKRKELLDGDNIDAVKTQKALEDARIVFEVFGLTKSQPALGLQGSGSVIAGRQPGQTIQPKDMTKEELLDLALSPKGKEMIKAYQEMYQQLRYNMPFMEIPTVEGTRQANEDFIRGSFDNRLIIDPSTGEALTMKDEKGDVRSEFTELHAALVKNEAIYNGRFTPQNLLTQAKGANKSFVRGMQMTIPTEKGKNSKTYFVSELPTLTKPSDINENVLWNKATEKPGAQTNVGKGVKVQTLITPEQKENVFSEQGPKWMLDFPQLTKSMFMSGQAVIVTLPNGETVPFMNYTKAAEYLANNGITLE